MNLTASIRVEPDFLIIGAQKSGTTSLYSHFKKHPQILMPHVKEIHFFDFNVNKGKNHYKQYFHTTITKAFRNIMHGKCITGEATPFYLFHPEVPRRVHQFDPEMKLIVILRDPIDRAISHYKHNVRMHREKRLFEDAIKHELHSTSLTAFSNYDFQHYSYLTRGLYAKQLQEWKVYFNQAQLLVLDFEMLIKKPQTVINEVFDFLGVSLRQVDNFAQRNKSVMPQEKIEYDEKDLVHFYKNDIANLKQHHNINFGWMDNYLH